MQLEFGHEPQKSQNHLLYPPSVLHVFFLHANMEVKNDEPTIRYVPKRRTKCFFGQISLDRTYRSTPYARLLILQCVWKNAMQLEFGHQSPKSTNHLLYLPLVIVSFFLHTNMEVKNDEHTIQCVLKRRAEYVFLFLWTTIFG